MHSSDSNLREKDCEVLRLLNQIATDMIRKSDVDRLVAEAVAKATAELKADYEERMKSMAAEYEARIAELQSGKGCKGNRKNSRKSGTVFVHSRWQKHMWPHIKEVKQRTSEHLLQKLHNFWSSKWRVRTRYDYPRRDRIQRS